jgi:hypothetical protein
MVYLKDEHGGGGLSVGDLGTTGINPPDGPHFPFVPRCSEAW